MTESDLLALFSAGSEGQRGIVRIETSLNVEFLASEVRFLSFEPSPRLSPELAASATTKFLNHPPLMRSVVGTRLFEAAQRSFENGRADFATAQEQLDFEKRHSGQFPNATVPQTQEDIWELVRVSQLHLRAGPSRHSPLLAPLVVLQFECAWDGEHGVSIFFANGEDLVHVGDAND